MAIWSRCGTRTYSAVPRSHFGGGVGNSGESPVDVRNASMGLPWMHESSDQSGTRTGPMEAELAFARYAFGPGAETTPAPPVCP